MIPLPNNQFSIVTPDGKMVKTLRLFFKSLSKLEIEEGVGAPEGVVSAKRRTLYMDTAGTAGAILYIKRDDAISGDTTQGWILV